MELELVYCSSQIRCLESSHRPWARPVAWLGREKAVALGISQTLTGGRHWVVSVGSEGMLSTQWYRARGVRGHRWASRDRDAKKRQLEGL